MMNQRSKQSNVNLSYINTDTIQNKTARKDRQRFTKPSTPLNCIHKSKEKQPQEKSEQSNQHLLKGSSVNKQQNIHLDSSTPTSNAMQYSISDESDVEMALKTSNPPKQRSKSTVSDREPWGQLLKKQKAGENESVFCSFDPLRSLHFLSKELEIHIQALLPDEKNIREIIKAMQLALKRVPPEVASTIHLQQSIALLPGLRKSTSQRSLQHEIPEKPYLLTEHKSIQTLPTYEKEEVARIQKLMEESTVKLEESCRHLETICTQLKNEKIYLEAQLQSERTNADFFKKKIEDLENTNRDLTHTIYKKDEEITNLKSNVDSLEIKVQESHSNKTEVKSIIGDLKQSKLNLEQECVKLKHQLRLCAIEKEKYLAVLTVRDRQINEIRNEMTQLQDVVNDQLVELHSNALVAMPNNSSTAVHQVDVDKENTTGTLSSISPTGNKNNDINSKISGTEFHSEESEILFEPRALDSDNMKYFLPLESKANIKNGGIIFTEHRPVESQTSINIRDMFSEIKKQAYALTTKNFDV